MTVTRMDNVGIVFEDLDAAIAFFVELGMEVEGRAEIEGPWADQCVGLDNIRCSVAMLRTPNGQSGRLELSKYHRPAAIRAVPNPLPPNTLGFHRVMFAVDDLADTLARLRPHGAEVLGEVARYQDSFLLCYVRGPEGVVVGLAEDISSRS